MAVLLDNCHPSSIEVASHKGTLNCSFSCLILHCLVKWLLESELQLYCVVLEGEKPSYLNILR